jgi:hypothetical protein
MQFLTSFWTILPIINIQNIFKDKGLKYQSSWTGFFESLYFIKSVATLIFQRYFKALSFLVLQFLLP